jgi:hypothetical protein
MKLPMMSLLLGQKRPSRSVGGIQNRSSEFGPKTQPSCITELPVKDAEISFGDLTMNCIDQQPYFVFKLLDELTS